MREFTNPLAQGLVQPTGLVGPQRLGPKTVGFNNAGPPKRPFGPPSGLPHGRLFAQAKFGRPQQPGGMKGRSVQPQGFSLQNNANRFGGAFRNGFQ